MSLTHLTSERRTLIRLVLLISAPLAFSALLSLYVLSSLVAGNLDRQAGSFGQVLADQLAVSSAEYLLSNDLLSLNVMLANLVKERHLLGAAVYSADNRLLVEAGRSSPGGEQEFTAEIHYQDSIAGYIRVTLDRAEQDRTMNRALVQILVLNGLLIFAVATVLWRYPGVLSRLLFSGGEAKDAHTDPAKPAPKRAAGDGTDRDSIVSTASAESERSRDLTVLVLKLKPARLAGQYVERIAQAVALYQGEVVARQEDEWTVHFRRDDDHCFHAICAGLLIQLLTGNHSQGFTFDGGIQCAENPAPPMYNAVTKQAIYLASLGSGKLLAGEQPLRYASVTERVMVSGYHSSLAPDFRVFAIDALREPYQALVERQAAKLGPPERRDRRRSRRMGQRS